MFKDKGGYEGKSGARVKRVITGASLYYADIGGKRNCKG